VEGEIDCRLECGESVVRVVLDDSHETKVTKEVSRDAWRETRDVMLYDELIVVVIPKLCDEFHEAIGVQLN
jgi:hypothetical protein